ncbi:MAG: nicotinate phosphoribosyltransferase [Alphaproteobacteria bacterium]
MTNDLKSLFQHSSDMVSDWTDHYFKRTKSAVDNFGDVDVTYAVFMRRPVVSAPGLAVEWIKSIMAERGQEVKIDVMVEEGHWVGAGQPLLYITGPFAHLSDLETIFLMKLGPACVAAYNAYSMCSDLSDVAFLAMEARHCAGLEMAEMMAYAASVGSKRARRKDQAKGFIGNATKATAHFFGNDKAMGTMPHAFIGYAGSTVRAAEIYAEAFPGEPITVLVDYFAKEISDSLAVCERFPELAAEGKIAVRIDTPGSRFIEGLDPSKSYSVLEKHAPYSIRGYRSDSELAYLVGAGTSAAAAWQMRDKLDAAGFDKVKIVVSSGFSPAKCRMFKSAQAPIDVIGTGSFLPAKWSETYATADIIEYDGVPRVKVGREFLFRSQD